MVNADDIEELGSAPHTVAPPLVAVLPVDIPLVQGVPPELPQRGEQIAGNARHGVRHLGDGIHLKQLRAQPHIHGVQGDIEGNVPDDSNTPVVGVLFQRLPLLCKQVLAELLIFHLLRQQGAVFFQRLRLPADQSDVRPLHQLSPEIVPDGLKQGVVRQLLIVVNVPVNLQAHLLRGVAEGTAQELFMVLLHPCVIDLILLVIPVGGKVTPCQQSVLHQGGQVDEQGVARRRRGGHIGRGSVSRRHQRQKLPIGHAGTLQKINEIPCLRPHGADSIVTGQGG